MLPSEKDAAPTDPGARKVALDPGLYLVATPIGNARDITLRALDTLASADVLVAEDTRRTRNLLEIHAIRRSTPGIIPYHDHNGAAQRPRLLAELEAGRSLALVSDAGTPMVSDPGFPLVREALAAGFQVTAVPGASAVLSALTVSGMPTDRFFFVGFLSPKAMRRRRVLAELASVRATLIFYEGPKRLASTLNDMSEELGGEREVAVCRELTKRFEEVRRGRLAEMAGAYAKDGAPKGEVVVVVAPPPDGGEVAVEDIDAALRAALEELSVRDAASLVAERLGLARRQVYSRALALSAA